MVGTHILKFLGIRTVVGKKILELFFSCLHGGRGEHFERLITPFATLDGAVATLDNAVCDVR